MPTPRDAPIEKLWARALAAVHARLTDVLDGVFSARPGVAGNVESLNAGLVMFCGTYDGGHYSCTTCCDLH